MCTYQIGIDEFEDLFETFLMDLEGEVDAETVVLAWNRFAKEFNWPDKINVRLLKKMKST